MPDEPEAFVHLANKVGHALAWISLCESLRDSNRHVLPEKSYFYFESLLKECLTCRYMLMGGQEIFRARVHSVESENETKPLPFSDLAAPPRERAIGGRLNPEGIPYFYAALELQTAIAEVRPWRRARITVGKFRTARGLEVLDLTGKFAKQNASPAVQMLSYMVARPAHRDDRWAYLGTQYLAERIKAAGLNGILYDSALHPTGTNLALFSQLGVAEVDATVHDVIAVKVENTQIFPFGASAVSPGV